jgi:hypothetical protein
VVGSRVAELQIVLEGVPLPATKAELVRHVRAEDPTLADLVEALPDGEYRSIDEVAETLEPVQPARPREQPAEPKPESGLPPGGEAYTDASAESGWVRERGPAS